MYIIANLEFMELTADIILKPDLSSDLHTPSTNDIQPFIFSPKLKQSFKILHYLMLKNEYTGGEK